MSDERQKCSRKVLGDLAALWAHMDERQPITSAADASQMVGAGCRLILEGEAKTIGEAMAQAVLLLTLVRETMLEAAAEDAEG